MKETCWKITAIAHSGRKGVRGLKREDGRYPQRVGRTVKPSNLEVGQPLTLRYLTDEYGNDYSGYVLNCSTIVGIHTVFNTTIVETNNTIYTFRTDVEIEETEESKIISKYADKGYSDVVLEDVQPEN